MASRSPTLDELRRYAIARSLFKPLTLPGAIRKLGFVQADPMRAPARAQDLICVCGCATTARVTWNAATSA